MIDIPLGKALVPVEAHKDDFGLRKCSDCVIHKSIYLCEGHGQLACHSGYRKDGKTVIFKLVDSVEEKK